jgi:large subunit ribosomal protein L16
MAHMPKRVKFRKSQRGRIRGKASRGNKVSFGDFGLQALGQSWVTARQMEAGRVAATHFLQREGKVYIRMFPHKPISAKPVEVRMGKGKGEAAHWVACIKEGMILYEIGGVTHDIAKQALSRMANKMPVRCRMVCRSIGY